MNVTIEAARARVVDSVAVFILDRYGTKLLNADSCISGQRIELNEGANRLQFAIRSMPLNPGHYVLGLWLSQRPAPLFDYIEQTCDIEIVPQPGDTRLRPQADGLVHCDFGVTRLDEADQLTSTSEKAREHGGRRRFPERHHPDLQSLGVCSRTCLIALRQSGVPDLEVIVVDDGSTDDTTQVVAATNPATVYLTQKNSGPAAARNRGFQASRGRYIAFLDCDDELLPNAPAAAVQLLERHPEVDLLFADAHMGNRDDWLLFVDRIGRAGGVLPAAAPRT